MELEVKVKLELNNGTTTRANIHLCLNSSTYSEDDIFIAIRDKYMDGSGYIKTTDNKAIWSWNIASTQIETIKEIKNDIVCWCCNNENVTRGYICINCGEIVK